MDYKDLLAELHAVAEHLKGEGHALGDKVDEIWHGLMGETAAAPVAAEAEHDAEQVAKDAASAVEEAVAAPTAPAAEATTA